MQAILVSSDLMLIAAAQGAADRRGAVLVAAPNGEQTLALSRDAATRLIVIDLRTPGLDVTGLVPNLRHAAPAGAKIVACGPHVHTQSLAAAAAAGCDEVITRGEFDRRIDILLGELTAPAE